MRPVPRDPITYYLAGAAFLIGVASAVGTLLNTPFPGLRGPAASGEPLAIVRAIGVGPADWIFASLASPLLVLLVRKIPLRRTSWQATVLTQAGSILLLVTCVGVAYYALIVPAPDPVVARARLQYFLVGHTFSGFAPFAVIVAAAYAFEFHSRFAEREQASRRLDALLSEARLQSITARLQPHFLFNTLQGISTMIDRDPSAAHAMLTNLGELLRRSMSAERRPVVPLIEEIETLLRYTDIARQRFGSRFVFALDVEEGSDQVDVPHFLLQPIVENSVIHALEENTAVCRVSLQVKRTFGRIRIRIADDGPGFDQAHLDGRAIGRGLENVRRRLREIYGEDHELRLSNNESGGACVTIVLPDEVLRSIRMHTTAP